DELVEQVGGVVHDQVVDVDLHGGRDVRVGLAGRGDRDGGRTAVGAGQVDGHLDALASLGRDDVVWLGDLPVLALDFGGDPVHVGAEHVVATFTGVGQRHVQL